jgi:hypothetical protein
MSPNPHKKLSYRMRLHRAYLVMALRDKGWTWQRIADRIGRSRERARQIDVCGRRLLREYGWPERRHTGDPFLSPREKEVIRGAAMMGLDET